MAPSLAEIPGPQRAAVLLVLLGEDTAAKLVRHLSDDETARIAREISRLGAIEPTTAEKVLQDYYVDAARPVPESGGKEIARRVLERAALPEERVARFLDDRGAPGETDFAPLLRARPEAIARVLSEEHPQTAAVVLLRLPPPRAAKVLEGLPEAMQTDAVLRMTSLGAVHAEIVEGVAASLGSRLGETEASAPEDDADPIAAAAEVLISLGRAGARRALEAIEAKDPDRAADLRRRIFTFESIVLADDRGVQELLRAVDTKALALALRGAEAAIEKKIFANLSERAASILKDEIEFLGAVRPEDQEAARKEIVNAALKLEEEGRLVFEDPASAEGA